MRYTVSMQFLKPLLPRIFKHTLRISREKVDCRAQVILIRNTEILACLSRNWTSAHIIFWSTRVTVAKIASRIWIGPGKFLSYCSMQLPWVTEATLARARSSVKTSGTQGSPVSRHHRDRVFNCPLYSKAVRLREVREVEVRLYKKKVTRMMQSVGAYAASLLFPRSRLCVWMSVA